jgi:hypothetical protein
MFYRFIATRIFLYCLNASKKKLTQESYDAMICSGNFNKISEFVTASNSIVDLAYTDMIWSIYAVLVRRYQHGLIWSRRDEARRWNDKKNPLWLPFSSALNALGLHRYFSAFNVSSPWFFKSSLPALSALLFFCQKSSLNALLTLLFNITLPLSAGSCQLNTQLKIQFTYVSNELFASNK